MENGGTDNGKPGVRADYGPKYYAAFVVDPDGYRIEAYHQNTNDVTGEIVRTLVAEAAERYASGAVDQVKVVYQNFVSTFEQRATLRERLSPC